MGGRDADKRGLAEEKIPVLVVPNRAGQPADYGLPLANKAGLLIVLPEAFTGNAVLCTDGSAMWARGTAVGP